MTAKRKMTPTHEAPYLGLRVLDFGQGIASPYCAMLLGVYIMIAPAFFFLPAAA